MIIGMCQPYPTLDDLLKSSPTHKVAHLARPTLLCSIIWEMIGHSSMFFNVSFITAWVLTTQHPHTSTCTPYRPLPSSGSQWSTPQATFENLSLTFRSFSITSFISGYSWYPMAASPQKSIYLIANLVTLFYDIYLVVSE